MKQNGYLITSSVIQEFGPISTASIGANKIVAGANEQPIRSRWIAKPAARLIRKVTPGTKEVPKVQSQTMMGTY